MYIRSIFKKMFSIIPPTVASTGTTAAYNITALNSSSLSSLSTTRVLGANFSVTIYCTTGTLYLRPASTVEPVVTNSYVLNEGESLDVKVLNYMAIKGSSTTAMFQAIVWE